MGYVSDKFKGFLRKIRASKRLTYLVMVSVLVLFCVSLNITYGVWSSNTNIRGANIIINDLKYRMVINEVELDESVGTKIPSNTIIGDRIIVVKAGKTEQFNVILTSLNDIDTKYELIFKVCTDETCTDFIDTPSNIQIAYHIDTPYIKGKITSLNSKSLYLVSDNQSESDYYVQIGLNVGYSYNELVLQNQISSKFTPLYLSGNLDVIATVDGEEVDGFPTEPDYETNFVCKENDGSISKARGIFRYTAESGWEFDVYGLTRNHTTCYISFTSTEYVVTYELLETRLDCANITAKNEEPVITYTGDCEIVEDSEKSDGYHHWKLRLTTSGTLSIRGQIFVDAFLVGGGQGGAKTGVGGAGGKTIVYKSVRLANDDTYTVTIGEGGSGGVKDSTSGKLGTASSLISNTSAENFTLTSANGYNTNAGGAGGSETASNNKAGSCRTDEYSAEFHEISSGIFYAGGGGGSGYIKSAYYSGSYHYTDIAGGASCGDGAGAGAANYGGAGEDNTGSGGGGGDSGGGAGGSGVVIIRDARA